VTLFLFLTTSLWNGLCWIFPPPKKNCARKWDWHWSGSARNSAGSWPARRNSSSSKSTFAANTPPRRPRFRGEERLSSQCRYSPLPCRRKPARIRTNIQIRRSLPALSAGGNHAALQDQNQSSDAIELGPGPGE
jgi:hypothetical protein